MLKYDFKIGIERLDLIWLSSWRRPHSTAGGHVQLPPCDWLKITRPAPSFVQGDWDPWMQRKFSLMVSTERWTLRYRSVTLAFQLDGHTINGLWRLSYQHPINRHYRGIELEVSAVLTMWEIGWTRGRKLWSVIENKWRTKRQLRKGGEKITGGG